MLLGRYRDWALRCGLGRGLCLIHPLIHPLLCPRGVLLRQRVLVVVAVMVLIMVWLLLVGIWMVPLIRLVGLVARVGRTSLAAWVGWLLVIRVLRCLAVSIPAGWSLCIRVAISILQTLAFRRLR